MSKMNMQVFEFDELPKEKQIQEIHDFKERYKDKFKHMGLDYIEEDIEMNCKLYCNMQWYWVCDGVYYNIKFEKL